MKVLNGSITKCDCGSILEYDRSDVVHAIECPVCKKLTKVDLPVENEARFSTDSFEEIHNRLVILGKRAYPVGAIKEVDLKDGSKLKLQVAHRKDDGGLLVAFYDLLTNDGDGYAMNSTRTTKGGYKDCDARKRLNGEILDLLPDDLVKYIVPTKVDVGNGEFVEDKIFLPSIFELFGKKSIASYEEGEQLELFKDWHNRIAGCPNEEYGCSYWTRSVYSAESFCYVYDNGCASYGDADSEDYLRPLFQIK